MRIIFTYLSVLLFFVVSNQVCSQEQAINSIVQEDLKRHLTFISSDELKGRKIGEGNGLERTADYIEEFVRDNKLNPINHSFSQEFDVFSIGPDKVNSSLVALNLKENENFNAPFICLNDGLLNFDFNGNAVFAGFGLEDESTGYNDYEGVDVKGKIVFISMESWESYGGDENFSKKKGNGNSITQTAFEKGAAAVVLISNANDKTNKAFNSLEEITGRSYFTLTPPKNSNREANLFVTTPDFADFLLGGRNKYKKYLSSIVKNQKPNTFSPENYEIEIHFRKKVEPNPTRNIYGIVEGSDPILKNEYVVFMAHYDHLGIDKDSEIYNGADDNGSGTTVLLELAEAFSSMKVKPKRSILFLWVTCEELGLYGSRYYSEHPIVPMGNTVACINLDMVGRVYEQRDSVWKDSPKLVKDYDGLFTLINNVWPGLKDIVDSAAGKLGLNPDYSLPEKFLSSSDHYFFHKNGVPILNVANGYHADYHKVTDEISKINFDKMKRVADFCFMVGYEAGNIENIQKTDVSGN